MASMKRPPKVYIYGKHAVGEALANKPHTIRMLYIGQGADPAMRKLADKMGVPSERLDERKVTSMVEGKAPHQGLVALLAPQELLVSAEHFADNVTLRPDTLLVFLSEIQDPHNVGAIIRSAAALGASAILLPTHKQSPVTAAVVRASAGMVFSVPLVAVDNPQQLLATLKKKGVRIYGFAADSTQKLEDEDFPGPTMLVFGNEGAGVAPYARALCDTMLAIDIDKKVESLNVAASAAIALYAWRTRRA